MSSPNPKCPKCQSAMEQGFIMDREGSTWVQGPLEKSWGWPNTKGREKLPVITFRCARCGYLESYAVSPQA